MSKELSKKDIERMKKNKNKGISIGNIIFLILYLIINIFLIGLGIKGILWAWNWLI